MKHLTLNGQEVFKLRYVGDGGQPWNSNYVRICRPFVGREGSNTGRKAEILFVKESKLVKS